nr:hypothetical protein [Marinicella sp. W31]MDC2880304.1 hypothetical protein [Marinicella sp. W31]
MPLPVSRLAGRRCKIGVPDRAQTGRILAAMKADGQTKGMSNPQGPVDKQRRYLFRAGGLHRLGKELQPALKMPFFEFGDGQMRRQRTPLIPRGAQQR